MTNHRQSPLGLELGASQEDIRRVVKEMTLLPSEQDGIVKFVVSGSPKKITDIQTIICSFYSDKLWQIMVFFEPNEHEPRGTSSIDRFEQLKVMLCQRYGLGKEANVTRELYEDDSWVYGIFLGENILGVGFNSGDLNVNLNVIANDSDTTQIVLQYELQSLKDTVRRMHQTQELDAL